MFRGGFLLCALLAASSSPTCGRSTRGRLHGCSRVRPLRWIGMISYGLYLWHWPIFVYLNQARTGLSGATLDVARIGVHLRRGDARATTCSNCRSGAGGSGGVARPARAELGCGGRAGRHHGHDAVAGDNGTVVARWRVGSRDRHRCVGRREFRVRNPDRTPSRPHVQSDGPPARHDHRGLRHGIRGVRDRCRPRQHPCRESRGTCPFGMGLDEPGTLWRSFGNWCGSTAPRSSSERGHGTARPPRLIRRCTSRRSTRRSAPAVPGDGVAGVILLGNCRRSDPFRTSC